ncbi:MAG: hypothetical protein H7A00_07285 [Hahellaceae bacterium]|nr:hypothetical protein [Hahellaceae bacterium]
MRYVFLRVLLGFMVLGTQRVGAAQHNGALSITDQWLQGLSGALLTYYSGSVISNNSSLTTLRLCRNGRYSYEIEGSWSVPGQAGGASANRIMGRWEIREIGGQVMLYYRTDAGEQAVVPLYLQNNGRVNIGGTAFAIQQGGAGC